MFNLRAENRREGLSNRRGTQSCIVSTIRQDRCSPCLVLRCPIHALAGQVEGGNVLGCVSEWNQSHEVHCKSLCPGVPDNEGKRDGVTVESVMSLLWPESLSFSIM